MGWIVAWCRFLFFSSGTGRILAGTQESLLAVAGTDEVDLEDSSLTIGQYLSDQDMGLLMAGVESAFHKNSSSQLMKPVTVSLGSTRTRTLVHSEPTPCTHVGLVWVYLPVV